MAIPFKPAQLKELLQRHQALQSTLREAAGYEAETRSQAALAAKLLQQELLREVFRTVPVEELGRQKPGLRFKPLKDAGYNTVADLMGVPVRRLTAINGVGQQTGADLCNLVQELEDQAAAGLVLKLNYDARSTASDSLVQSLYRFRTWQSCTGDIPDLRRIQSRTIEPAIKAA